jgi:radical SAM superfamily enzyme YgiQ (UPF0313 family)
VSRIFLISTNTCCSPYPAYPLGMATVAGTLIEAGHIVRQFDWLVTSRDNKILEQAIKEFTPDVVAVSIRNIDNIDSLSQEEKLGQLNETKNVISLVRQLTNVPIIIGGTAISLLPDEVFRFVGGDIAVAGEAEKSIIDVIRAVLEDQSGPSIWPCTDKHPCNIQSSPYFEPSIINFYWEKSGIIGIQSKRGCPYNCSYCGYPKIEGATIRPRPVEAVTAELEKLKRDCQVDTVFFVDSVFNDPEGAYLELAEALALRNLEIKWAAYMSPHGLTKQDLKLCKRAGLYAAELGTDAACDVTLEAMNKPFRWSDVRQTNNLFVQAEIPCAHFVIFGGPEETETTIRKGLDNIEGLENCVVMGYSGIRIYPRTQIYQRAIKEGLIRQTDTLLEPVYYISPKINKAWMDNYVTKAWAHKQDRVFPPEKGQTVVTALRSMGYKGLLWERMVDFKSAKV